jgi:hypothetical protein
LRHIAGVSAAVIGAERAIYVVEADDARGEAVVFHIVLAEFLRVEPSRP